MTRQPVASIFASNQMEINMSHVENGSVMKVGTSHPSRAFQGTIFENFSRGYRRKLPASVPGMYLEAM